MITKHCKCGLDIRLYNARQALKELRENLIIAKLYNCKSCIDFCKTKLKHIGEKK
jgi:hypothetical protein